MENIFQIDSCIAFSTAILPFYEEKKIIPSSANFCKLLVDYIPNHAAVQNICIPEYKYMKDGDWLINMLMTRSHDHIWHTLGF